MADGTVIIDTLIDTKGFGKGVTNMRSQFAKLSGAVTKLGAAVGIAFGVAQIVQFSKAAIDLGSDLQEVQNVVDVTFGGMSKRVDEFAQTAIEQFGLSELSAKQYASTLGAIFKSSGFDIAEATEMSTALAGLAGDIASFYNLSGEEAFTKLRAGITGETEPLKQLGINLNVANLEAFALSQGITKAYDAMSQQEQMMLRYNYILNATADAQGDFARTSQSWANQTRILTERFNSLKATIGQGLINALTPVIQVINTILIGLQKLANAFKQFTALLFGDAGGGAAASNAEAVADSYGSAAESAEDMAAASKSAAKSAKILSGLDEVNIFNSGSGGGGGDASALAGGGFGGELDLDMSLGGDVEDNISPKVQAIVDKINELLQPLKEIDFTPMQGAFSRLGSALAGFGSSVQNALGFVWDSILVPLSTWTIEEAAPALMNTLATAFSFLASVLDPVVVGLQQLFQWLSPVFDFIGGVAVEAINLVGELFADLAEVFQEKGEKISEIISMVGEVIAEIWAYVAPFFELAKNNVSTLFRTISNVVSTAIGYIIDILHGLLDFIMGVLTGDWERAWNGIKEIFIGVWDYIKGVASALSGYFSNIFNNIKTAVLNVWETIKTKTVTYWNNIRTSIANILNRLLTAVKTPINGIIGAINGMISGVVSGINAVIRALNRLNFTIPSWVPAFGGRSFGFNIGYLSAPQIPYLAKGAVIPPNAPFTAVLGDQRNGRNLEAPESLIRQIIREETGGNNGGTYKFTAQINRRVLFEEIIEEGKRSRDATGNNPFLLA